MTDLSSLFFFGVIVVGSIVVAIFKTHQFEARIAQTIHDKGFKLVSVSRRWFDFDEGTASFDVVYRDRVGFNHETRCKIRSYLLVFDGDLYWTRPLVDQNDDEVSRRKYEEKRSVIIDNLRLENKVLKERIEQLESLLGERAN